MIAGNNGNTTPAIRKKQATEYVYHWLNTQSFDVPYNKWITLDKQTSQDNLSIFNKGYSSKRSTFLESIRSLFNFKNKSDYKRQSAIEDFRKILSRKRKIIIRKIMNTLFSSDKKKSVGLDNLICNDYYAKESFAANMKTRDLIPCICRRYSLKRVKSDSLLIYGNKYLYCDSNHFTSRNLSNFNNRSKKKHPVGIITNKRTLRKNGNTVKSINRDPENCRDFKYLRTKTKRRCNPDSLMAKKKSSVENYPSNNQQIGRSINAWTQTVSLQDCLRYEDKQKLIPRSHVDVPINSKFNQNLFLDRKDKLKNEFVQTDNHTECEKYVVSPDCTCRFYSKEEQGTLQNNSQTIKYFNAESGLSVNNECKIDKPNDYLRVGRKTSVTKNDTAKNLNDFTSEQLNSPSYNKTMEHMVAQLLCNRLSTEHFSKNLHQEIPNEEVPVKKNKELEKNIPCFNATSFNNYDNSSNSGEQAIFYSHTGKGKINVKQSFGNIKPYNVYQSCNKVDAIKCPDSSTDQNTIPNVYKNFKNEINSCNTVPQFEMSISSYCQSMQGAGDSYVKPHHLLLSNTCNFQPNNKFKEHEKATNFNNQAGKNFPHLDIETTVQSFYTLNLDGGIERKIMNKHSFHTKKYENFNDTVDLYSSPVDQESSNNFVKRKDVTTNCNTFNILLNNNYVKNDNYSLTALQGFGKYAGYDRIKTINKRIIENEILNLKNK